MNIIINYIDSTTLRNFKSGFESRFLNIRDGSTPKLEKGGGLPQVTKLMRSLFINILYVTKMLAFHSHLTQNPYISRGEAAYYIMPPVR